MNVIEVIRGGLVESTHEVWIAVADAEGRTVARVGDADAITWYRSAAKPMQALPLVEDGVAERFGLTADELALCCASHEGEDAHLAGARSILRKAGVEEEALACGAHIPFAPSAVDALFDRGSRPERIHNNCSGKHAGMLALTVAHGWPLDGYHEIGHPLQQRILDEMARWTGMRGSEIPIGVDGCGVPCFAAPLSVMAASFARFASEADAGKAAGVVTSAMMTHPFMVGGTGRACTDVMTRAGGRAFVKLGAEGVYGGGLPGRGLGFAIKVPDGGRRAVEVALVHLLAELDVLDQDDVAALSGHANPPIRNTRGEVVGALRAQINLPSGVGS